MSNEILVSTYILASVRCTLHFSLDTILYVALLYLVYIVYPRQVAVEPVTATKTSH